MSEKDDLLDILDSNGKQTGESASREFIHKNSIWHESAHLWIYSSAGNILMQKRSMEVENHPGEWDTSVAGHVDSGETALQAIIREAKEELGIDIEESELSLLFRLPKESFHKKFKTLHREYWSVFCMILDEKTKLEFDKDEVEKTEWISYDKFLDVTKKSAFSEHPEYIKKIKTELYNLLKND